MDALTNPAFEELVDGHAEPTALSKGTGSYHERSKEPLDVTVGGDEWDEYFEDYDGMSDPKPDIEFVCPEMFWVLRTLGGRFRAGKSYRPDPSGSRTAVKAADYSLGSLFFCEWDDVDNHREFFEFLKSLSTDPTAFIIRGMRADWGGMPQQHRATKRVGYVVHCRSVKIHGDNGYFAEWPFRHYQILDLDGVPLPQQMSVVADPETCVKWAVQNLLQPEFGDASFVYQLSSSAGLTKADNELNVHLWFYTQQAYKNEELRAWARWWNAKRRCKIIDPALFTEVQPHYTNEPELLDGLTDPLAGRRLGLVTRAQPIVDLYMPTAQEVAQELGLRQKRASKEYNRARPTKAKRNSKNMAVGR